MDQRTTGCAGKIRYSAAFAYRRARIMRHNHRGEIVEAYYCKFCGHFHLGHVNQPRRRRPRVDEG